MGWASSFLEITETSLAKHKDAEQTARMCEADVRLCSH